MSELTDHWLMQISDGVGRIADALESRPRPGPTAPMKFSHDLRDLYPSGSFVVTVPMARQGV